MFLFSSCKAILQIIYNFKAQNVVIICFLTWIVITMIYFTKFNNYSNQIQSKLMEETTEFNKIWNDIFNASKDQLLIPKEILIKTTKFMIKDVEEDDPELVEFVRSLIVPPSISRLK